MLGSSIHKCGAPQSFRAYSPGRALRALGLVVMSLALTFAAFGEDSVLMSDSVGPLADTLATRSALTAGELASPLEFSIPFKLRHAEQFQARINNQQNITEADMIANYYPLPADVNALKAWLQSKGFVITNPSSQPLSVYAKGSIAQIQAAFKVAFARVAVGNATLLSAATAPSLPAQFAYKVYGVNGLQPYISAQPVAPVTALKHPLINNAPPFYPSEILAAYNYNALPNAPNPRPTGVGQEIAIITDFVPDANDLNLFRTNVGILQAAPLVNIYPTGLTANDNGSASIMMEWASGIAPNAQISIYVVGGTGFANLSTALTQIKTDRKWL